MKRHCEGMLVRCMKVYVSGLCIRGYEETKVKKCRS